VSVRRLEPSGLQHDWNVSEDEAIAIQNRLASLAVRDDELGKIATIAGVDVAYDDTNSLVFAAVAVIDVATWKTIEIGRHVGKIGFAYVPGLFAFRELPHLLTAMDALKVKPDLVVCDGQGMAHPRRCGLATHLGLLADLPTIGCGKTRHIGEFATLGEKRGSTTPLLDGSEIIGKSVRTQDGVKPLFVSIGHRVSLATAVDWILRSTTKFRQPEPIRRANEAVCEMRARHSETAG
jgi:deoxyribonuclease V